jgi:hypothetical protein
MGCGLPPFSRSRTHSRQFWVNTSSTFMPNAAPMREAEHHQSKYWLSTLPADIGFEDLVDRAKLRWGSSGTYQDLKQELGLGDYEGRGWRGSHHHVRLRIAAYGFLIAERAIFPLKIPEMDDPRRLPFPAATDPKAPPLRAERHIPNAITTLRRRLVVGLIDRLPRCPCCGTRKVSKVQKISDAVRMTQSMWPALSRSRKFRRLLLPVVPNRAKLSLPICVQTALAPRWRAPMSSTVTQFAVSTSRLSPRNASCRSINRRMTWRLEMLTPTACSCTTRRSTGTRLW